MAKSDDLVRLMLTQADEHAFVFLDVDGTIVEWSAGAEKIFGYARDEIVGSSGEVLFTPESRARGLFGHELAVARAGGKMEDDRWMFRKDGSKVWVGGLVQSLHDQDGRVVGFCKIMRNRTDLKTQTEFLERQIDRLNQREDLKRQVFATLAHELRNPLAPLRNVAEIFRMRLADDAEVVPMLDILDRQISYMTKMIDDLLDATRVEQGKVHLEKSNVDLVQVLHQVVETCRPQLDERKHQFWLHVPPTPIVVHGDPIRLQQIFTNLLGNAIKYTPDGGHIYLRATLDSEAIVTLEDDGVGIAPDVLPQVFDLFTQEKREDERAYTGLGIGLSLVKDLVRLHNGSVQAKSDGKNKGSTFTIHLPLAEDSSHTLE